MSKLLAKSLGRVCPNFKVLVETSVYLNIFHMLCGSYAAAFYSSPQKQRFRRISIVIMHLMSFVHYLELVRGHNPTVLLKIKERSN